MKKAHIPIIFLLIFSNILLAQSKRFLTPLSVRTASYDIDLTLDVDKKQVKATQTLTFINPSDDTIWTMPFHMYYNAFKNNKSTFLTGTGRIDRSISKEAAENCEWGWVEVLKATDSEGNDLEMQYIQPEDSNPNDHTVLEIKLKRPVLPRATYVLEMDWHSQIPKIMARTGYQQEFYFMAQWYPKLGVYEPAGTRFAKEGQWNCHQYHTTTEYYGEFGVYNVSMTVPKKFKLAASGFEVNQKEKGGQITYTYLAEDVIDFTWTASPNFVEIKDKWKDVDIKLMMMPEHLHYKDRYLNPTKKTLEFLEKFVAKYPYPYLTVVSPPVHGLGAGAMEYATLFTAPTLSGFPMGIRTTETLVIHELVHQFFYQIISTNEQEEPWMDEGFTAYFEAKIMDEYYPKGIITWDYMNIHVGSEEFRRGRFFNAENIKVNPMSDAGWEFRHGSYAQIVYGKGATMLSTLENMVGTSVMKNIIQTYYERWKFKHPCRQDFIDIVNEIVPKRLGDKFGSNMDWFFEQAIYGTEICDYEVHDVLIKRVTEPWGFFEQTEDCEKPTDNSSKLYESKIIFFRQGEFIVPQEIKVTFDNGEEILEYWDGKSRSYELKYVDTKQVTSVIIDPEYKIQLDKNLINNSFVVKPTSSGISRYFTSFVSWMESIMVTVSMIV